VVDNWNCLSAPCVCVDSGTINTFKNIVSDELGLKTVNYSHHISIEIIYCYFGATGNAGAECGKRSTK